MRNERPIHIIKEDDILDLARVLNRNLLEEISPTAGLFLRELVRHLLS